MTDVLREIAALNQAFQELTGARTGVFKVDLRKLPELFAYCPSRRNFFTKMSCLASILKMNVKALQSTVENYEQQWGGIRLFEAFLEAHSVPRNPSRFKLWHDIEQFGNPALRGMFAEDSAENIRKRMDLDAAYPTEDFHALWDGLLGRLLQSLRDCNLILRSLIQQKTHPSA
ncbi:MAG: hypothetical protein ACE5PO_03330 [Candidatus Bathyarchaeia archaeon]